MNIESEFIFERAPFASCHASTIAETKAGLIASWFGGTAESNPDVTIWVSRKEGDGWTVPVEVADGFDIRGVRYPCWNPVLFQPDSGPLMLFYKVGPSPREWWGMLVTSDDHGRSWSSPSRLETGILGPIKNKPVQLSNGDILSPSSTENSINGWRVHFERSSDRGASWRATTSVNDGARIGAIQPSILDHGNHHLQAIGRTRQGKLFTIESNDNGNSWSEMTLTDSPNPNSGTDAVALRDGRFLLIYNHSTISRTPLNLAISDDGKHWEPLVTLEASEGEFSYPAIIQTGDGAIHITFTWNRSRIKHVSFMMPRI